MRVRCDCGTISCRICGDPKFATSATVLTANDNSVEQAREFFRQSGKFLYLHDRVGEEDAVALLDAFAASETSALVSELSEVKAEKEKYREALGKIADQGYWSSRLCSSATLATILDENTDAAREALADKEKKC